MDRAVSDVLGYVLIFTLIVSSVAVVTVGGTASLGAVRDAERFSNAQRVFDVLDTNVEDHLEARTHSRATEIRLTDAGVDFGEPVELNVTVGNQGSNSTTLDPLVYHQSDRRRIVYGAGAVLRHDRGATVLVEEPPFRFGNRTMLTFVDTRAQTGGVSGSGRVLLRSEYVSQSVHEYPAVSDPVVLNVTTRRPAAWQAYLEAETGQDCSIAGDTVSCTFNASWVAVRTVTVDLAVV
jgi:hypothetical protein